MLWFLLALLLAAAPAWAGVLDASWIAPTTNTDGSPLTDLGSYRLYWQIFPQTPCPGTQFIVVNAASPTPAPNTPMGASLTTLTQGFTYNVQVTAVDTTGKESPCSTVASAVARPSVSGPPKPGTNLSLTFSPSPASGQTVLDTDAFSGTSGTALNVYSASWPVFANWNPNSVIASGGLGEAINGGASGNRRTGKTWTADQWAEITVGPSLSDVFFFVGVRMNDAAPAGNGYGGGWANDTNAYRIVRWNPDGSQAVLLRSTTVRQAGDVMNLQAKGQTITLTVRRGGVTLPALSVADQAIALGSPGVFLWDGVGNRTLGTSWRAGSVQ